MKACPILFSGPMVRALLDGSKTQTRRICKPAETEALSYVVDCDNGIWGDEEGDVQFTCPYGRPGDLLWVRETFDPIYPQDPSYNGGRPIAIDYRATPTERMKDHYGARRWKPAIHMPKKISRLTLRITSVRVEQLQHISDVDALAEGVDRTNTSIPGYAAERYKQLWEQINGAGAWDKNPWVWVVEFEVIKKNVLEVING